MKSEANKSERSKMFWMLRMLGWDVCVIVLLNEVPYWSCSIGYVRNWRVKKNKLRKVGSARIRFLIYKDMRQIDGGGLDREVFEEWGKKVLSWVIWKHFVLYESLFDHIKIMVRNTCCRFVDWINCFNDPEIIDWIVPV